MKFKDNATMYKQSLAGCILHASIKKLNKKHYIQPYRVPFTTWFVMWSHDLSASTPWDFRSSTLACKIKLAWAPGVWIIYKFADHVLWYILYCIYIYNTLTIHYNIRKKTIDHIQFILSKIILESSVVSAHVLGSFLLPLFFMNLPIQKNKNMAALATSTLHLPQANPKNKIPYTK